ncbi:ParB N-terminal domain-containing protein [Vreelandella piezotolerans]|uniref:ParB N-terminal domain-containing protein n=1 Tax=Vreelandella piezotolerans TaxID=2609667 RepID=UPI0037A844A4
MSEKSEIKMIDVEMLHLDFKNPRLPSNLTRTERAILKYIASTTSLEDLMEAIAKNGFFPGEPLVAVEEDGKLIVVEGNRRLSAVKLLNDPEQIENPGRLIRSISDAAEKISELPVVVKSSRAEVLPYLGFRHITGVKQWEPLSKARYMRELFTLTSPEDEPSERYKQVARMIGSRSNHIKRSLDALAVYENIEREDFYDIPGLDEESIKFAVLSTALADERIAAFVGTQKKEGNGESNHTHPIIDPKSLSSTSIKDLTNWLYRKNESGVTRVGESRNLKRLGSVLESEKAKKAFMSGSSLEYAFRLSKGSEEEFMEYLYTAQAALAQAASLVANIDFSEQALEVSKEIRSSVSLIGKTLSSKRVDDDDF